jgi:hypothetical protein
MPSLLFLIFVTVTSLAKSTNREPLRCTLPSVVSFGLVPLVGPDIPFYTVLKHPRSALRSFVWQYKIRTLEHLPVFEPDSLCSALCLFFGSYLLSVYENPNFNAEFKGACHWILCRYNFAHFLSLASSHRDRWCALVNMAINIRVL